MAIGERRRLQSNGPPGYLCADSVHQGDGIKGLYVINLVDAVKRGEVDEAERLHNRNKSRIRARVTSLRW